MLTSLKAALTPKTSLWDAILQRLHQVRREHCRKCTQYSEKRLKSALGLGGGGGGGSDGAVATACRRWLHWRARHRHLGQQSRLGLARRIHHAGAGGGAAGRAGVPRGAAALGRQPAAVLDGMGRFALGGMVPRMPAFAAGGLAGGSNVTIQFPGLPAIGGLRASSDVVDQLHRAAALAQVRSGGRKPSRYC